jgi:hypothetical protein
MALEFTQPLTVTEMPEDISGGNARPERKAKILAAIYETVFLTLWNPQHFTTLFHGLLQGKL